MSLSSRRPTLIFTPRSVYYYNALVMSQPHDLRVDPALLFALLVSDSFTPDPEPVRVRLLDRDDTLTTHFLVETLVDPDADEDRWALCIREDLLEAFDGVTDDLPVARFHNRADAETFISDMCALMHMGGDPDDFRIVPVRA